jgi:hypothetical protein
MNTIWYDKQCFIVIEYNNLLLNYNTLLLKASK